jgi:hypothetical protein
MWAGGGFALGQGSEVTICGSIELFQRSELMRFHYQTMDPRAVVVTA